MDYSDTITRDIKRVVFNASSAMAGTYTSDWFRMDWFARICLLISNLTGPSTSLDVFIDQSNAPSSYEQALVTSYGYFTSVYAASVASGLGSSTENISRWTRFRVTPNAATAACQIDMVGKVNS